MCPLSKILLIKIKQNEIIYVVLLKPLTHKTYISQKMLFISSIFAKQSKTTLLTYILKRLLVGLMFFSSITAYCGEHSKDVRLK